MASEVDQQIERAREVMARIAFIVVANALILLAAGVAGLVIDLGLLGGLVVLGLMVAVTLAIGLAPAERAPTEQVLREVDIKVLPARTERWLEAKRDALPRSAGALIDRITTRLGTLSPQLGQVENDAEAAHEVRRLIGEQLPAFVNDYARVPEPLRAVERNGRTPDGELVAGLQLIEGEIAAMTERLARADLDNLETRGRFLEAKYKGDEG